MYHHYFGLAENPFSIAPNPQFLYMSDRHREALAHLTFGLRESGGFVLLTGEVGTGKTTVCRCLLEQLPENTDVAFIFNPTLTEQELLATLCDDLGIAYPPEPSLKQLTDLLHQHLLANMANGRETVLIIDEAQHLLPQVLEQLRLLTNLETNTRKLLQVILIGQPELQQLLARRELRQLAQRITARYHLLPLNVDEVGRYLNHRLQVAGCNRPLFTRSAVKRLHRLSGGVPRLINLLADRALLGAYARSANQVEARHVAAAADEILLPAAAAGSRLQPAPLLAVAASVLLLLLALAQAWWLLRPQPAPAAVTAGPAANAAIAPAEPQPAAPGEPLLATAADGQQLQQMMANSRDLDVALALLFERWGLDYANVGGCDRVGAAARQCFWREEGVDGLLSYNLPAALRLLDEQGRLFYATLVGREGERLRLILGGHELDVTRDWLAEHWQGAFVLLWAPPPGYRIPLTWNASGEAVQWLENSLSLYLGQQPRRIRQFDRALDTKVRQFQQQQGLTVDGAAGVQTLIQLSNALALDAPWLVARAG